MTELPSTISSDQYLILAAELKTLQVMAEVSGDFVHMKIKNDIEEPLMLFMKKTMKLSMKTGKVFEQSNLFQAQKKAFETWPLFCKLAKLPTTNLEETAKMYIEDTHQNKTLVEIAKESIRLIEEF